MYMMHYMKFTAISVQTLQQMLFIDICKCVYEVGYYIKPPATASWGTQFCHCMLDKVWNTVRSSSGDISLALPRSCILITLRQEVGAQLWLFWAQGNWKRQESSNVTSFERCLKESCVNEILDLDTSISLRPCAGCLHPCLDQAHRWGSWETVLFLNLSLIHCSQVQCHYFILGCTFPLSQILLNRHDLSQISAAACVAWWCHWMKYLSPGIKYYWFVPQLFAVPGIYPTC